MMSYEESKVAHAKLVEVIKEIAAGDTTRRELLIDVGGPLFDANFLDGYQYQLLYDLRESPKDRALIEKCLAHI